MTSPAAAHWSDLPVTRLRFVLEPLAPYRPAPFVGTMFRGALGHAIKRVACVRTGPVCDGCSSPQTCGYPPLFEPRLLPADAAGVPAGPSAPPPPFTLAWEPLHWDGRTPCEVEVRLFGPATPWADVVVAAVIRAARCGLGEERREHRVLWAGRVEAGEELGLAPGEPSPLVGWLSGDSPPNTLGVELVTPVRMKQGGQIVRSLDPVSLVVAAERRLRLLHGAWAGGSLLPPDPDLRQAAEALEVVENDTHWSEWTRYSNRQKRALRQGGVDGRMVIAGDLSSVFPVLCAGAVVHVGSSTSFGMGRLLLEALA